MKKVFILLLSASLFTTSCKKENTSGCWVCQDDIGNYLQTTCGDNEQDAFNKSGMLNGIHTYDNFKQHCHKQ